MSPTRNPNTDLGSGCYFELLNNALRYHNPDLDEERFAGLLNKTFNHYSNFKEVSLERRAKRNSKQVKRRKKNKIAKMSRRRNR